PPPPTLFPSTTLFRSPGAPAHHAGHGERKEDGPDDTGRHREEAAARGRTLHPAMITTYGPSKDFRLDTLRGEADIGDREAHPRSDRKSTRLNSSHLGI